LNLKSTQFFKTYEESIVRGCELYT